MNPFSGSTILWSIFLRSVYVSYLWKQSLSSIIVVPEITSYGWYNDGTIEMVNDIYPKDVEEVMNEIERREEGDTDDEEDIIMEDTFAYESDIDTDDEF